MPGPSSEAYDHPESLEKKAIPYEIKVYPGVGMDLRTKLARRGLRICFFENLVIRVC
jgi:hypothetical protein